MNKTAQRFLIAFRAALEDRRIKFDETLSAEEWTALFRMSEKHHVFPMIYEAVYQDADRQNPEINQLFSSAKSRVIQAVMMQTMKTSAFGSLYRSLEKQELHPLVVKGIICRNLYKKPDYRMSGDEDLLIDPSQYERYHEALLASGMIVADQNVDLAVDYEIPYVQKGSPLYIEIHKSLFSPQSDAYGDFNQYFTEVRTSEEKVLVDGVEFRTMSPSDHLFYLICHAFKHFLHSGFGLRQVSDIVLFANVYGAKIDWESLLVKCREIHADLFTAALFRIGENYLVFDPKKACYPKIWSDLEIEEEPLLEDLLDAGVFGDGSMSRKHSSNMTLHAVTADKQGKEAGKGILNSLFPSVSALESRYSYLKKRKYLLPVAWLSRIWNYRKEMGKGQQSSASESIKIGEQRVDLFRKYGIIKSEHKKK